MTHSGQAGAEPKVLIELFTSQGCSSCPPADQLLSELSRHDDVIPLSFHVDYWNSLGWRDPFSAAAFTERQRRYVRQLDAYSAYTPMLVVDGMDHCVGSQRDQVNALIEAARQRPRQIELSLAAKVKDSRLLVELNAALLKPSDGPLEVWLAVAESGLETAVGRGENRSRKLRNDHVVRRLERLGAVAAKTTNLSGEWPLDSSWRRENLEVVAFVADPTSGAIGGATRFRPDGPALPR